MNTLAALALLATAPQGIPKILDPVGPIKPPTGPITVPGRLKINLSVLANPGFEIADDKPGWAWKDAGYAEGFFKDGYGDDDDWNDDDEPVHLAGLACGSTTAVAHSGKRAFDFATRFTPDPYASASVVYTGVRASLSQELVQPVLGGALFQATAWGMSQGGTVTVTIYYTVGRSTAAQRKFGTAGPVWEKWDFAGAIDPKRKVSGLVFSVDAAPYGNTVYLDDVALLTAGGG